MVFPTAGGSGIHRPIPSAASRLSKKQAKKQKKDAGEVKTGKEYKAKKAIGDMKLRGKPDPYAYIPLSRKTLNHRKKMKNSGKFKNVIKSAMKGAQMGKKAKARRKR